MVGLVKRDGADLTARGLAILMMVDTMPGPHTVRALTERLGVPKPSITRALSRLETLDLVRRDPRSGRWAVRAGAPDEGWHGICGAGRAVGAGGGRVGVGAPSPPRITIIPPDQRQPPHPPARRQFRASFDKARARRAAAFVTPQPRDQRADAHVAATHPGELGQAVGSLTAARRGAAVDREAKPGELGYPALEYRLPGGTRRHVLAHRPTRILARSAWCGTRNHDGVATRGRRSHPRWERSSA